MLNAGNRIGTIKNAFSVVLKLRLGKEKIGSLFTLYPITASIINAILNDVKREIVDSGVS
jgi:hypothetical protein